MMRGIEAVLAFVDELVYTNTGEHLNDLQRIILRESWQETKKTYDRMAQECGYSPNYIKQAVAPQLWRLLSRALGEKVTKSNIRSVLERHMVAQGYFQDRGSSVGKIDYFDSDATEIPSAPSPDSLDAHLDDTSLPPVALELPNGCVPLHSPFYIERVPDEARCARELVKPGALIRIKSPRQMGKTSLMNRMLIRAEGQAYKTASIDFQQAEESTLGDLNKLLRWFCTNLTRQLRLAPKLDEYWDEDLGSKMSCTLYIRDYLLESIPSPIVLAFDEVSALFEKTNVAGEFLTLLRSWHESAKVDELWQKLRLVLVQSTEVYLPLDINQSPFNVGLGIELKPLTPEQVRELAARHQLTISPDGLAQLMALVAGHPYLIRLTLYHLARGELSLNEILETAATETGIYRDHLHRHLWNLKQHPELAAAFNQVLQATEPIELEQVQGFKLYSMGLIDLQGNQVDVSCQLYRQYFRDRITTTSNDSSLL